MNYKSPDNSQPSGYSLHVIEPEYAHLLPVGCVPITDDEAEAIRIANTPVPTLAEVKEAKWKAIKVRRDTLRFDGGVNVNGHWFKSNQIAIAEYNSIISLGFPDSTVLRPNWRTIDNGEVAMTPLLAKQIINAGFMQAAAIDDAAQTHKAAMEASSEPAAYDFSGSWPQTYGDL